MKNMLLTLFLILLIFQPVLAREENLINNIDTESFFSEENLINVSEKEITKIADYTEEKLVNLTGRLAFDSYYSVNRDWIIKRIGWDKNQFLVYTDGDLFLDVRLKKGIKAYLDINFLNWASNYGVSSTNVSVAIKELFVDYNLEKKVFVRVGKQFWKWGVTYFWNPVDLINPNRPNFLNLSAIQTGVYGTKIHLPLGYNNAYFFLNSTDAKTLEQISLSSRYEFLLGNNEMGVSMWNKKNYNPIYGFDLSSRLLEIDVKGELAVSQIMSPDFCVNLGKTFNWERPDRIILNYEFYYNGDGYQDFVSNDAYLGNYLFRYYHAFFISITQFPLHSATFSLNGMQNLVDHSAILSSGLTYSIIDNFQIISSLFLFFGDDNREFMASENGALFRVVSILTF